MYTYLFCQGFKKPINRLIFYAAWGNLGTTVAGLLADSGLKAGQDSALCQFQAFVLQMFQGVDAYWALCMSLNVYLALFRGWNTSRIRSQEWKYLLACYGLSSVPAITYLFITVGDKGRVYGPAILWCWITPEYSFLRVATLYSEVWLALAGALVIYCIALVKAWRHRRALLGLLNPLNENPFGAIITTDIEVIVSLADSRPTGDRIIPGTVFDGQQPLNINDGGNPYTVNVEGLDSIGIPDESSRSQLLHLPSMTRKAALAEENCEAWLYARVAFLYFLVMMICWIPASINRLVALIDPTRTTFGLNLAAIVFLPLQGFLNALVYCISSQTGVRNLLRFNIRRRGKPKAAERIPDSDLNDGALVFKDTSSYHNSTADSGPKGLYHLPMVHLFRPHRGNVERGWGKETGGKTNNQQFA